MATVHGRVGVGDVAPEFTLTDAKGEPVSLADFRGKSEVVVFFYPKSGSPACTAEACSFRDSYEAFRDAGAEVIGISSDTATMQGRVAGWFKLPFHLLSDPGGKVRAAFGVPRTLGLFPGRVSYLIDREGIVRHITNTQFLPLRHVHEMLRVLKELRGAG